ncbi:MAG TPA: transcriptional regulator [Ktedonobacterales bacterium]
MFEELAGIDRLVHEPARLAILTALANCTSADFLFLQRLIGLTKGNLSSHLAKLEEAGLVSIEKSFAGKVPHTSVRITESGRVAVTRHWEQLERLRAGTQAWQQEGSAPGAGGSE